MCSALYGVLISIGRLIKHLTTFQPIRSRLKVASFFLSKVRAVSIYLCSYIFRGILYYNFISSRAQTTMLELSWNHKLHCLALDRKWPLPMNRFTGKCPFVHNFSLCISVGAHPPISGHAVWTVISVLLLWSAPVFLHPRLGGLRENTSIQPRAVHRKVSSEKSSQSYNCVHK